MRRYFAMFLTMVLMIGQPVFVSAANDGSFCENKFQSLIDTDTANKEMQFNSGVMFERMIKEKTYSIKGDVIEHRSLVCLDNSSDEKLYRAESIFIAAEEGKMNELLDSMDKINLKYDSEIKAGQIAMLDSDYNHRNGADSSGSIRGYVNVYFSCSTKSGLEYVKINKVTGGYEKEARTVAVNTQSVEVHQKGRTYSSGTKAQTKKYAKGSSTSWTITPPASWIPVSQDTVGTMVGAKCTYGLKRTTNGETWKFSVNCPVVTNAIG